MSNSKCPRAWSDMEMVETISLSSLNINPRVNNPEQVNQIENNNEVYLPPELMEKIVCHFDGKTLLKYKQLSKTCNDIANNALRYNKIWRKICLEELPKKYLIDLITKEVPTYIPLDSIPEVHYERVYKNWLEWQNPIFKISKIGQHHFLGLDGVVKIICHKLDVMVIFSNFMYLFSLTKNQKTGSYVLRNSNSEICKHNAIVVLNPRPQTNQETGEDNFYINCRLKHANLCPLHNTVNLVHDGNRREHYTGKLVDVDMNAYTNVCCWIRETWYEWHSHGEPKNTINGHLCPHLSYLLYASVIHGLIISRNRTNSILIHGIFKDSCIMVDSWLNTKYSGATSAYMHTNILFIGTLNGYLLAYRMHSMDDLIKLKDTNMLLEIKMDIGQIIMLDIMDFEDVKAIIVASTSSVLWLKIN
ncbi:uncharacterized protein LOC113556882 [Rhopalosiphum maidis]|uniref:uncharacterized protein LOC113556882 n=1 Tax=Rhopalosiphum maidis TaxID=43146 RepID=UPI000EFF03E6|nr:uncharacterized protein LOC113556882 [Rhopalosiphum maidis]